MLPRSGDIPTDRWDFRRREPIGAAELHLGDHGDEIVSGLIEWHRVEARLGLPELAAHRGAINRMLDRLLAVGRTPNGLWYDGVDVPSSRIDDRALNDNWGYLGLAYLDQAALLRASDPGDPRAAAYERAVRGMLQGATGVDFYKWERGEMDGYADTLESALYLLRYLDHPGAAAWVDEQMAVLYGFEHDTGAVTDENIDGNYIRTVLQYGRWLTRGARLDPWEPTVAVGAAPDGACLIVHLHAARAWTGRLRFDTPRHRQHLGLPVDYPRLNQWHEWWVADPDRAYRLYLLDGSEVDVGGRRLADGFELAVDPGHDYRLRVCPI
jgi:hypothetical protein